MELTLGLWFCIVAILVKSAILFLIASISADLYWLISSTCWWFCGAVADRFRPAPLLYRPGISFFFFAPRSSGPFWAVKLRGPDWGGLTALVIDTFGNWGSDVGMCNCFWISAEFGGDRGVLGGVGGWDGGLGSCFGGPSDRFSKILPGNGREK